MNEDKPCTIQIGGISASVTDAVLMNMFRTFGPIVRIKRDNFSGAHVAFTDKKHAMKAIKATNGAVVEGKAIRVSMVPTFTKTYRPCRGFQAGICRKGDACKYYHNVDNATTTTTTTTPSPATIPTVKSTIKSTVKPTAPVWSSPSVIPAASTSTAVAAAAAPSGIPESLICRHFARGYCSIGAACNFAHVLGGAVPPPRPPSAPTKKIVPCLFFANGLCTRGEECNFLHEVAAAPTIGSTNAATSTASQSSAKPTPQPSEPASRDDKDSSGGEGDDSRTCIECEQPGVAQWSCKNCDDALYCDDCNAAVHKPKVMTKHKRTKLPPVVKKPKVPKCGECETMESVVKCEDCDMTYCENCNASVHKFKSLRKHTRVPLTGSAAQVKDAVDNGVVPKKEKARKTEKRAESAPSPSYVNPPVEYIKSIPKYEVSSDSDSDTDEDDSDNDDVKAHPPFGSSKKIVAAPVAMKKLTATQNKPADSSSSESSDDEDIVMTHTTKPANNGYQQPADISSESSDDEDEKYIPTPASHPSTASTKKTPLVKAAPTPIQDPVDLSDESSEDFDDIKVHKPMKVPTEPTPASEDTSSSSSDDSSDDDDVKQPVAPPKQQQPAGTHKIAASRAGNSKPSISLGSSHSLVKKIEAFYESDSTETLHLDPNLNGFERLLAHDCAERLGLDHVSVGEGLERHITISRRTTGQKRSAVDVNRGSQRIQQKRKTAAH